jgi:hypothetical protein
MHQAAQLPKADDDYLWLLKQVLTNMIYGDSHAAVGSLAPAGDFDPEQRREGKDWPVQAHTMVGLARLDNLQACVETVLDEGIPGDFIETGVWRGGASILVRGILKHRGVTDRRVWVADSFQGLPASDAERYPADAGFAWDKIPFLAVSEAQVRENFARYGLLDGQVRFLPGWFRDTLPTAPIDRLAVLRLDGDLYESTIVALDALYPKLSVGGFVIVDDYALGSCRKAVEDYRAAHGLVEAMTRIDWTGVYWRKASA